MLLAGVGAVAFLWLLTLDVHAAERNVDGVPAFCGSAYDVALLKRDGYMGGEIPTNQAAVDSACVAEARKDVALAGLVAMGTLGLSLYAFGRRRRTPPRVAA